MRYSIQNGIWETNVTHNAISIANTFLHIQRTQFSLDKFISLFDSAFNNTGYELSEY